MVKYEYYIKKARGGSLRPEDLRIILMLSRNVEYPSVKEVTEAERIIEEKQVNINVLGISLLRGENKNGVGYYNNYCKKVTDCLSVDQWKLLKKYYGSIYEKRDDD